MPRLATVLVVAILGGLLAGATGCGGSSTTGGATVLPAGTFTVTLYGTDTVNTLEPTVQTTFTITVP
jgi:hypothetical protein